VSQDITRDETAQYRTEHVEISGSEDRSMLVGDVALEHLQVGCVVGTVSTYVVHGQHSTGQ